MASIVVNMSSDVHCSWLRLVSGGILNLDESFYNLHCRRLRALARQPRGPIYIRNSAIPTVHLSWGIKYTR